MGVTLRLSYTVPMPPRLLLSLLLPLLAACQSPPRETYSSQPITPVVDLAGHWELDHARSDNIQQRLNTLVRQLQVAAQRRARAAEQGRVVTGAPPPSGRYLLALAEMAEIITSPTLLEVLQNDREIRIRRENSFALVCAADHAGGVSVETAFGIERCYWDGQRLVFLVSLPDGFDIKHQISGSAATGSLLLQTAVYSPRVDQPFVVNRVYRRYNPGDSGFYCTETLSKGRVCTTEQPTP